MIKIGDSPPESAGISEGLPSRRHRHARQQATTNQPSHSSPLNTQISPTSTDAHTKSKQPWTTAALCPGQCPRSIVPPVGAASTGMGRGRRRTTTTWARGTSASEWVKAMPALFLCVCVFVCVLAAWCVCELNGMGWDVGGRGGLTSCLYVSMYVYRPFIDSFPPGQFHQPMSRIPHTTTDPTPPP